VLLPTGTPADAPYRPITYAAPCGANRHRCPHTADPVDVLGSAYPGTQTPEDLVGKVIGVVKRTSISAYVLGLAPIIT